jgi:hypothetical protein
LKQSLQDIEAIPVPAWRGANLLPVARAVGEWLDAALLTHVLTVAGSDSAALHDARAKGLLKSLLGNKFPLFFGCIELWRHTRNDQASPSHSALLTDLRAGLKRSNRSHDCLTCLDSGHCPQHACCAERGIRLLQKNDLIGPYGGRLVVRHLPAEPRERPQALVEVQGGESESAKPVCKYWFACRSGCFA